MKRTILPGVLLLSLGVVCFAQERTIITVDGTKYLKAEITEQTTTGITISHQDGITKIPSEKLSPELFRQLGYASVKPTGAIADDKARQAALDAQFKKLDLLKPISAFDYPAETARRVDRYNAIVHVTNDRLRSTITEKSEEVKRDSMGRVAASRVRLAEELKALDAYKALLPKLSKEDVQKVAKAVRDAQFFIGMPREAFRISKGEPDKINHPKPPREQWVYATSSYYFENDLLTDAQL